MRRLANFVVSVCTLLVSAPLMAQDFGKTWVDRVTHELIEDDAQLSPHPVEFKFTGGELYSYDSNIFLTKSDRTNDSIFTTFAGGTVKYAKPNFDAEADLLINYNAYASTKDIDADEERFFGRMRYQGTKVELSLAEIFRRESSPTDATFTTRVSRFLSNTTPLIIIKASDVFAIELQSDLQLINYLRQNYSTADNFNSRTLITLAYTTGWNNVDLLVQGGYWEVTYQNSFAPPDADGFIGRLGVRGEISPNLHVIALAGISSADSQDYIGTNANSQMTTGDFEFHLAYTLSENTTWWADYSRRFGFSADGAPYQVVDDAGVSGQIALREDFKLTGRFQYDRIHDALGLRRAYYSIGMGAEYRIHPHITLDAGITWRWGVTPGVHSADFGDGIFSIGAAVLF